MSKIGAVAALLVALGPGTVFAQFGGMGGMGGMGGGMGGMGQQKVKTWAVKIETVNGKSVTGTLSLFSVNVDYELGLYALDPEKIKSVRFTNPGKTIVSATQGGMWVDAVVTTVSGEEVAGPLAIANWNGAWTLKTDLGVLTIAPEKLKSISTEPKPKPPATSETAQ